MSVSLLRPLLVLSCVAALAVPASAQDLRLNKGAAKKDLQNVDKMRRNASVATRGYYDAMIKGDYDVAATFVHPFLVSTLKTSMGKAIRKLEPKTQVKAVEKLGLKSIEEFDNLGTEKFFKLWAASDFGFAAATLANPEVAATYRIEGVRCELGKFCDVTVDVRGRNQGGKITSSKSMVRAAPVDGAWRVGAKVVIKAESRPDSYKGPKLRKAQREKLKQKKLKKGK